MENLYANPIVFKIQNATPRSDVNLCPSCRFAHIFSPRDKEARTICAYTRPFRVSGPVEKCNVYQDKSTTPLEYMEAIAWRFNTDKSGKSLGFEPPKSDRDTLLSSSRR